MAGWNSPDRIGGGDTVRNRKGNLGLELRSDHDRSAERSLLHLSASTVHFAALYSARRIPPSSKITPTAQTPVASIERRGSIINTIAESSINRFNRESIESMRVERGKSEHIHKKKPGNT